MTRFRIVSSAAVAAVLLAICPDAEALANRVFVSARGGSDLNSCGNINTPCQTLQGAVNQVVAGGAVLVLDTGGYGPLTIDKAVTIEAPTGIEAFIHPPSGTAIQILAGGGDVIVLRGLTLSGAPGMGVQTYGIDFVSGGALHVEECTIQGFDTGIVALRGSETVVSDVYVEDTVIRSCALDAIVLLTFAGTVRGSIEGCRLEGSSFGLHAAVGSVAFIRDSVAAGNSAGIGTGGESGRSAALTVDRCISTNNSVAGIQSDGISGGSSVLRISNSNVTGNGTPGGPSVWGGMRQLGTSQLFSRVNNTVEGNTNNLIGTIGTYTAK
jgi:hypothetical protein